MTNYLDKEGLKKFWDITKGKYSVQGHTHDDRYLKIGATAADSNKLGGYASSSYVKTITIGHKSDYQDTVILLWEDGIFGYYREIYVSGILHTENGGSERFQCADMNLWFTRWGEGSLYNRYFQFNSFGQGVRMKLVTCTYEGKTWWAIQHTNIQFVTFSFTGKDSGNISWKPIIYYNQNTKQVLNQEIYDSIVDQSDKLSTFYVGDSRNALMKDIPTKLSQLSDDVVKGKYLPMSGGTLNGTLTVAMTDSAYVSCRDQYGEILLYSAYNRGLRDRTRDKWIIASHGGTGDTFMMNGNVGINTMAPDSRLHVNGTFHSVGASTLDSTLSVGGAATLNSSLTVKGATTVQGLTANGATSVQDLTVNGVLTTKGNGLALYHATPFIDFHYGNSSDDYNVRIWNNVSGGLQINAHTLIDLVGPMKSSGGRLWITNGDTNIYDVKTTGLTSYVPVTHQSTSYFLGNVGIGTDADAAYKLKVNGKAYFGGDADVSGNLKVSGEIQNGNFYTDVEGRIYTTNLILINGSNMRTWDSDGKERNFNLQKAIELGVFS